MRKPFLTFLVILLAAGMSAPSALAQGGIVSGKVLDEDTEAPIANAIVVVENPSANPPRIEEMTNDQGDFTMLGLNSGAWSITPSAEGYQSNPGTVLVRQGNNPALTLYLRRILHPLEQALGAEALEGLDPVALGDEIAAADAAYESTDWDAALSGYDSVFAKLPMMTDLQIKRGNTLQVMERFDEAIEAFEAAATGNPQLRQIVDTAIVRLKVARGDEGAAEALASSGGGSREDLYNLGEVEFGKGNVEGAIGWYEQAAAADPDWALPLFKLGLAALNQGDMEGAKGFFAQVVEKDPSSAEGAQAKATLDALP